MDKNRLLIINDVTGYGRVSSFAMMPIMTAYGHHPYVLPTALVSNTMDYGSSVILDTTEYMKDCIAKWKEFGFTFPIIATGLINSAEQAEIITSLLDYQKAEFVMVDPIMADDGKLYPGMYEGAIECYRKLAAKSDLIIPNLTEAEILTGKFEGRDVLSSDEYQELLDDISRLGAKDIVITGCTSEDGKTFNLVYDSSKDQTIAIGYDKLPFSLIGTGDVFSATLLSEIMRGSDLFTAVDKAAQLVRNVVIENENNPDHFDINIEKTLQEAIYEIRQR
ncbi:MAG: bifunctional hydroxymethylpyrimidine kinase/phosphomethylpyrimidine kinase [Clostridiales bacterium]|nr:bifunctional hydroxymethylpyrimidine kinase/phosphomethylpyrimidine kinase [Candidatus Crickella equi]